jgi:hypothetical protein
MDIRNALETLSLLAVYRLLGWAIELSKVLLNLSPAVMRRRRWMVRTTRSILGRRTYLRCVLSFEICLVCSMLCVSVICR